MVTNTENYRSRFPKTMTSIDLRREKQAQELGNEIVHRIEKEFSFLVNSTLENDLFEFAYLMGIIADIIDARHVEAQEAVGIVP